MHVLILLGSHIFLLIFLLLVIEVVTKENLNVLTLSRRTYIIIFNELLLLADHILQVNNRSSLQLKVEKKLHVLRLQEVVLYHKLEEVLIVLHLDAPTVANRVSDRANLRVVLVEVLLHRLPLDQILLCTLIKDLDLLLVKHDLLLEHRGPIPVLLSITLTVFFVHNHVVDLLDLLEHEDHFGLSFADLERVSCILFVELNKGLLQLKDLFIRQVNLCHHILLLFFIEEALITLASAHISSLFTMHGRFLIDH